MGIISGWNFQLFFRFIDFFHHGWNCFFLFLRVTLALNKSTHTLTHFDGKCALTCQQERNIRWKFQFFLKICFCFFRIFFCFFPKKIFFCSFENCFWSFQNKSSDWNFLMIDDQLMSVEIVFLTTCFKEFNTRIKYNSVFYWKHIICHGQIVFITRTTLE